MIIESFPSNLEPTYGLLDFPDKDYLAQIHNRLNIHIQNEFQAIHQYIFYSISLNFNGIEKLAETFKEESLDELKHVDLLTGRLLVLGGSPIFSQYGKIDYSKDVEKMLQANLDLETKGIIDLRNSTKLAEDNKDYKTASMLTDILNEEEEHALWLNTELRLLGQIGKEKYIQMYSKARC